MTPTQVSLPDASPMSYDLGDMGILNNLSAYNLHEGVDRQLDLIREVYSSEEYYPLVVPFPNSQSINIAALQQLSGNLSVPPGAILVMITGYSDQEEFKLRVFDSSSNTDLFYGMWSYGLNAAPPMSNLASPDAVPSVLGPHFLSDPYMVVVQNAIQVTVMNMASVAANIQTAFHFAVPLRGIRLTSNALIEGVS